MPRLIVVMKWGQERWIIKWRFWYIIWLGYWVTKSHMVWFTVSWWVRREMVAIIGVGCEGSRWIRWSQAILTVLGMIIVYCWAWYTGIVDQSCGDRTNSLSTSIWGVIIVHKHFRVRYQHWLLMLKLILSSLMSLDVNKLF